MQEERGATSSGRYEIWDDRAVKQSRIRKEKEYVSAGFFERQDGARGDIDYEIGVMSCETPFCSVEDVERNEKSRPRCGSG